MDLKYPAFVTCALILYSAQAGAQSFAPPETLRDCGAFVQAAIRVLDTVSIYSTGQGASLGAGFVPVRDMFVVAISAQTDTDQATSIGGILAAQEEIWTEVSRFWNPLSAIVEGGVAAADAGDGGDGLVHAVRQVTAEISASLNGCITQHQEALVRARQAILAQHLN